jgi:hypothetical protein
VGGSTPGADNHIAYVTTSQYDGVRIRTGCLGNFVSRNSIFSNAGWGIILGNSGVTVSNLVTLGEVVSDGTKTFIKGSMSSYANGKFLVQIYENISRNLSTSPGYGEGLIYLMSTNITNGANGQANFTITMPQGIPAGRYLCATATDSANTTWEFGLDATVAAPASFGITLPATQTVLVTNPVTHVVTTNIVPPAITATWPTNPGSFVLQYVTNLSPPLAWLSATNTITTNGAASSFTVGPSGLMSFYRLLFP